VIAEARPSNPFIVRELELHEAILKKDLKFHVTEAMLAQIYP
jgi:hypothetical protein